MSVQALQCKECGQTYPLDARYVCEHCFGPLEVAYDHSGLDPESTRRRIQAGPHSIWRYSDFLPFESPPEPGLPVGLTPLQPAPRLAERLGLGEVWIKNDTANPTHSFKDRVVAVALAKARELGYQVVACASTGNLAGAVAAHSAAAGLESYVFIPSDLEEQKVLATGVYGTNLVAVRGTYDDVNRLCTELSAEREWAFVNVNVRPYYAEGSKTLGFEIAEQLGFELPDRVVAPVASGSLFTKIARGFEEWLEVGLLEGSKTLGFEIAEQLGFELPDRVVAPVASGSLFTKIARGFEEWLEVGLLEGSLPTFNGAQAAGCSPVAKAYEAGDDFCRPVKPRTIAKSLAIGNPADGPYALDLARRSDGSVESVTDAEIRSGIRLLAETTGIFTETAGGVTTAVLRKLAEHGAIGRGERVVAVITGDGLKTLDAVRDTFTVHEIDPTFASFEESAAEQPVGAL